jgi:uncharacterized HhH-GPD family protein
MVTLRLSQEPSADAFLAADPLALLLGMLLDQQFPMERAFAGPYLLAQRLGLNADAGDRLDAAAIADADPEEFAALFVGPPAVHRFPGAMAGRVQALCRQIADKYDGDAAALWRTAGSGRELLTRLRALPGFGEQKARIFVALLGKQFGVTPEGWREAAAAYGEDGSTRSVADVVGPETLRQVREYKRAAKAAQKEG